MLSKNQGFKNRIRPVNSTGTTVDRSWFGDWLNRLIGCFLSNCLIQSADRSWFRNWLNWLMERFPSNCLIQSFFFPNSTFFFPSNLSRQNPHLKAPFPPFGKKLKTFTSPPPPSSPFWSPHSYFPFHNFFLI